MFSLHNFPYTSFSFNISQTWFYRHIWFVRESMNYTFISISIFYHFKRNCILYNKVLCISAWISNPTQNLINVILTMSSSSPLPKIEYRVLTTSSVSVSPRNWERSLLATRYIKHKRCDALDLYLLEFIIKLFFVT